MRRMKIKIEVVPLIVAQKVLAKELKVKRVAGTKPYRVKTAKLGQI